MAISGSYPSPGGAWLVDDGVVLVVDDDAALRDGIASLFRSMDIQVRTFASAAEFLCFPIPDVPCCLVLDVRLRGASGLELQAMLAEVGCPVPVVFISGHADVAMSVMAMRAGATHFLTKPFRDQDLLDAVTEAIGRDVQRRACERRGRELRAAFETLTSREREVMTLAAAGLMNKQIADDVGLSTVTVKIHRAQAMKKMGARTFAELVVMAHVLGLTNAAAQA